MITMPSHDHSADVTFSRECKGTQSPCRSSISAGMTLHPLFSRGTQSPCRGVGCPHSLSPTSLPQAAQARRDMIHITVETYSRVYFIPLHHAMYLQGNTRRTGFHTAC